MNSKKEYIDKVVSALENFQKAQKELSALWDEDHSHGLYLNEYLVPQYPFTEAFDDCVHDISKWVIESTKRLESFKSTIIDIVK